MILYVDTSALVKKYFKETGSKEVIYSWKEAEAIVTSSVAYAETMACFYRKKREAIINDKLFDTIIASFQNDWKSFILVQVNNDLNEIIDTVVALYPLRGFDSIHLASALIVYKTIKKKFLFACFDQRLSSAAKSEGLQTLPVNISPMS
ncbi:MAG: type II toxin-antitoxin system VapC family toxin [bacterium]